MQCLSDMTAWTNQVDYLTQFASIRLYSCVVYHQGLWFPGNTCKHQYVFWFLKMRKDLQIFIYFNNFSDNAVKGDSMAEPSLFSNPEKKVKIEIFSSVTKNCLKVMQLPPVELFNTFGSTAWPSAVPKLLIKALVLHPAGCTLCWHTHSLPGSVKCARLPCTDTCRTQELAVAGGRGQVHTSPAICHRPVGVIWSWTGLSTILSKE